MYKNRFHFWIAIFLIAVLIRSIVNLDISSIVVKSKEVTVNIAADSSVKSNFTKAKTGAIELVQTTNDPSIIIKPVSDETIDGYSKISNAIYSPIVMYIPTDEDAPSSLFYQLGGDTRYVNFVDIAEAIINDTTAGELGISDNDDIKDSTIILNLPSKSTAYYDAVIEQIYVSLNNNKKPTEEEKLELKGTVDTLIEKSVNCNDINSKLDSEMTGYNIFICPEYYMNVSNYGEGKGNNYYRPIYFEKTITPGYDVFIKSEETFGELSLFDVFIEQVLANENFVYSTKYRTSEYNKYNNLFYGYNPDNLDYISY